MIFSLLKLNQTFPKQKDQFQALLKKMADFDAYSVDVPDISTRKILKEFFRNRFSGKYSFAQLAITDLPKNNDIDFATFVMLFDAIFKQGLARPNLGIRALLDPLVKKIDELGITRLMNSGVQSINSDND